MRFLNEIRPHLTWPRVLLGLALLILLAAALFWFRSMGAFINPAVIRSTLAQLGLLGPLALILSLGTVLVVPILPASVLQIGAGLAFGPWLGLLYATIADVIGASVGFWLGRGGRSFLEQRLSTENHARLVSLTRRMSWHMVVLLRLIPGPAYPLVSLAAGHSSLGYLRYISASLAGVLPALILLVLAGDLVESSPILAFAIVVLVVASLAIAGRVIGVSTDGKQITG